MKRIGIISLGCDKNRTDTEKMMGVLKDDYVFTQDPVDADVIVINTCAFIKSAKEESIEEILSALELKKLYPEKKIVVTGCLPQRYAGELTKELKDVDVFLGVSDYSSVADAIKKAFGGEKSVSVTAPKNENLVKRVRTTDGYAYLKIADGCSNHCTFCAIPSIRGAYRSVPIDSLIEEVKGMGEIKELILVAQDTLKYGEDLNPKKNILDLIRALSSLREVGGIRIMYCYPENITDEFIHELSVNPKLIRYLDIPFQHADDGILKLMGRKSTGNDYAELVKKLRERVPGIAIRSTFMTGFPGEDEKAFGNLLEFIKTEELDNVGFFKYSEEEGTPAVKLPNKVLESVKTKRLKKLYSAQKKVAKKRAKKIVGSTLFVLAEGFDEERLAYFGRAYFSAPDIDGKIYFLSENEVPFGTHVRVKITDAEDYDFYGERV